MDLLENYYSILTSRTKVRKSTTRQINLSLPPPFQDTSLLVRKRVIRILRDVVEAQPRLEKVPSILAKISQRINDEDTVKKLCIETFQNLWFQPIRLTECKEFYPIPFILRFLGKLRRAS